MALGTAASFVDPMECLPVAKLPKGPEWLYEIKLDGWRLQAVKSSGGVILYSRRAKPLTTQFSEIATALEYLPVGTIVDGELVALSDDGVPSFNLLQNHRMANARVVFYAFDLLTQRGVKLLSHPLSERREALASIIRPNDSVELSAALQVPLAKVLDFIKSRGLEGVIAKRADSIYQPGLRTGLWRKRRINRGQEFVIGGYIPSGLGIDSLVVGFYKDADLYYAARVRAGFVPSTRREVYEKIKHLKTPKCPFVNLPEKEAGRWGQGLTAEKMAQCVWLKPVAIGQIEFLEWTDNDHLRHTKFVGLREDKDPRRVVRET